MWTEPILCTNIVSHNLMFKSINSLTTSVRAGNIIASVLYVGKLGAQKGFVNTQSHSQPYHVLTLRSLCMKCNARAIFWCFVLGHGLIQRDPKHNLMLSKSSTKQSRQEQFNTMTFSYSGPAKTQCRGKINQFPKLSLNDNSWGLAQVQILYFIVYILKVFF